jgi:predicted nucleic acid-binding protein
MPEEPKLAVIDASVLLKWQFNDEEYAIQAESLRDDFYIKRKVKLIAPQLLTYEIVNGITTAARHKRINTEIALEALNNLLSFGVETRVMEASTILKLSLKYNVTAYDAAYLALAENESCSLWTADKAFYQAMKRYSSRVRWIGEYGAG